MATQASTSNTVLVVNLNNKECGASMYYNLYKEMIGMLNSSSLAVTTVEKLEELKSHIELIKPKVLLFVNSAMKSRFTKRDFHDIVVSHLEQGGLAIFCCLFQQFIRPDDMNAFFTDLGLPWKFANYERTQHLLTPAGKALLGNNAQSLESDFSAKAVRLSGVAPGDILYAVAPGATIQSCVFSGDPDPTSCMAGMTRVRGGTVAYVGDVNAEKGASKLILALCNLQL